MPTPARRTAAPQRAARRRARARDDHQVDLARTEGLHTGSAATPADRDPDRRPSAATVPVGHRRDDPRRGDDDEHGGHRGQQAVAVVSVPRRGQEHQDGEGRKVDPSRRGRSEVVRPGARRATTAPPPGRPAGRRCGARPAVARRGRPGATRRRPRADDDACRGAPRAETHRSARTERAPSARRIGCNPARRSGPVLVAARQASSRARSGARVVGRARRSSASRA